MKLLIFFSGILFSLILHSTVLAASVGTLTTDNFKKIVNTTSGVVLVEISAKGCDACKELDQTGALETVSDKAGVKVYRITSADAGEDFNNITALQYDSAPTLRIFNNGAKVSDIPSSQYGYGVMMDQVAGNLTKAVTNAKTSIAAPAPAAATSVKAANPPGADERCHLVLITLSKEDVAKYGVTDCDNINFYLYLKSFLDQLLPYIMLIALLMIIAAGLQYMLSGITGDTKSARGRITGVLGGVIFYFMIRLILNLITPGLNLQNTPSTPPEKTVPTTVQVAPKAP